MSEQEPYSLFDSYEEALSDDQKEHQREYSDPGRPRQRLNSDRLSEAIGKSISLNHSSIEELFRR